MKRLLLVALVALAAASAASADSLPSAETPNVANPLAPQLLVPPAQPQVLSYDQLLPVWQAAGQAYGIPWSVLAAIDKVESNFGQNMGPSSAGAIGWMQFMPDTWARWGTDANADGLADPWNAEDAIYSAARYLAASGGATDIRAAVFSYNHAWWYVDEVLQLAQQYDAGGVAFSNQLDTAQQSLDAAKQAVVDANQRLLDAQAALAQLQGRAAELALKAQNADTFTGRLNAQKEATLFGAQVQAALADVEARKTELQQAQDALTAARDGTASTAFAPGAGQLLGAPAYSNGYVFPVAGGPGVVSVGHTHHDYPAADIAAPEGSQLYALSDGVVERSWNEPDPACGIGFTIATTDGLTWTYCHLSQLDPAVVAGASLAAGQPVGLVGQTGDATGPHLHLQLQPATGYPQDELWFQALAGTAFTWQDGVQANAAQNPVFSVVGADPGGSTRALDSAAGQAPVIFFTASGS
jgi:murein DD-endopeptidase MepM/ murein hydrolase activator NlpD